MDPLGARLFYGNRDWNVLYSNYSHFAHDSQSEITRNSIRIDVNASKFRSWAFPSHNWRNQRKSKLQHTLRVSRVVNVFVRG